jgi:hypothetical protein
MAAPKLEAVMNPIEKVMVRRSRHFGWGYHDRHRTAEKDGLA